MSADSATELAQLVQRLVTVQVRVFDAADAAVRAAAGAPLIAVLPMRVIAATPSCRVQEIADALGISAGGASKSVDRLEREGWARRAANPGDRRSSFVELTDAGRAVVAAAETALADVARERVTDVLGPDAAAFARALARLEP
jgi:DNA-binding MarR family transcriptional regulator